MAGSILKLLGLKSDIRYETLFFGNAYTTIAVHSVPDSVTSMSSASSELRHLAIRMDLEFNEDNLVRQIERLSSCAIVTKKPIDMDIIKSHQSIIKEIVYIIDEDHDF